MFFRAGGSLLVAMEEGNNLLKETIDHHRVVAMNNTELQGGILGDKGFVVLFDTPGPSSETHP